MQAARLLKVVRIGQDPERVRSVKNDYSTWQVCHHSALLACHHHADTDALFSTLLNHAQQNIATVLLY
jgi:hypothetical protein